MMKGIKYLRFSSDGQSNHSIERQHIVTEQWMKYNNIEVVDTFTDEGYSARNFDRPDVKNLFEFIRKHSNRIDYLVVSELTRFSRETGDAINMVKNIQNKYGVRIVSASRGTIYDCNDSNSFFMMGIEFLLGNSENLKRQNDINGGIYTAKAQEGRYIHGQAPFGYVKEGVGKAAGLVIHEEKASIIRFIYDAFLKDVPVYLIKKQAQALGFTARGNSIIKEILANPIYSGQQFVKAWGKQPGGIFKAKHAAIISLDTWYQVQEKLNSKHKQQRVLVSDNFPLRGVLKCHCGAALTGAPSKGRNQWYNYYKCNVSSKHNNFNADKAHEQLQQVLQYMSLSERLAFELKRVSTQLMDEKLKESRRQLQNLKHELTKTQEQLHSVEEKFINEQLAFEGYSRWNSELTQKRSLISAQMEKLNKHLNQDYLLLDENLLKLTNLQYVFEKSTTLQKQELIKTVFDSKLYYQDKLYRTSYIMPVFEHNIHILKQKQLLEIDEKRDFQMKIPLGGDHRLLIEPLNNLLSFLHTVQVA